MSRALTFLLRPAGTAQGGADGRVCRPSVTSGSPGQRRPACWEPGSGSAVQRRAHDRARSSAPATQEDLTHHCPRRGEVQ
jgi:hypothetical protein